jgi:hypothetical protein
LKPSDLPNENDGPAIFEFAMTFNGYEHFGSFEAAALAANSGDRSRLDFIRNELFFSARASRHRGDDGYIHTYRELLPMLRHYARSS